MRSLLFLSLSLAVLTACDREGRDYVPLPIDGIPGVDVLNEGQAVEVISQDDWSSEQVRLDSAIYSQLGPPTPGLQGGATMTFVGTGGEVCVMVDPAAVFWNSSVSAQSPQPAYVYPDNVGDDGDIDIEVGLSAYYTGSPGIEMGTFEQAYEDSLGNQITIEFNECLMSGSLGQLGAHAGRATPEYCTIDTSLHPGRQYTVVLRTWSLPTDDSILDYGVAVFEGSCSSGVTPSGVANIECTMPGESQEEGFPELEAAFCVGEQAAFCEENPGMCG